MSSEYARPGLSNIDRSGYALQGRSSRANVGSLPNRASEPDADEPGRFQPGTLSPVAEAVTGSTGRRFFRRPVRTGALGWLDRGLLVAEVACALVVVWLVAQYLYTAYFDTAPRRISSAQQPRSTASRSGAVPGPLSTVTRTPTPLGRDGQSLAQMGEFAPVPPATFTARPEPTIDPELLLPKRLRIPVMFLDSPVHEVHINMGTWEVSPMDIGHHEGTGVPGKVGNVVLAGHRDINSALFRELDRLQPGDEVFVSNSFQEYRYIVTESFVVGPTHTEVMDPTDDKRVTLITCTPIGLATQRLIVTAVLDESDQTGIR